MNFKGAVQGNLDPVVLFADWKEIQPRAEDILRRAAGRPGHIFNLGHGILPETPVDNVKRLCKFVQEHSGKALTTGDTGFHRVLICSVLLCDLCGQSL